jgi:hypothetical protein
MTKSAITNNAGSNSLNIWGEIDALVVASDTWHQNAYKRSNDELYSILSRCLDVYQTLRGNKKEVKQLNLRLEAAGLKCKEGTGLASRVVRLVFRSDAKRIHAYAKAIRFAAEEGVDSQTFKSWMVEQGGVEEVRRTLKDGESPAMKTQANTDAAVEHFSTCAAIGSVNAAPDDLLPSSDALTDFTVALLRKEANGTLTIVGGTNDPSVISRVLAATGKRILAERNISSMSLVKRNRNKELMAAIKAA